jgi:hypothetical protein
MFQSGDLVEWCKEPSEPAKVVSDDENGVLIRLYDGRKELVKNRRQLSWLPRLASGGEMDSFDSVDGL